MENMEKYTFGRPVKTQAVVEDIAESLQPLPGRLETTDTGYSWYLPLGKEEIVYGLGETMRGMNKRGWEYVSNNLDDPDLTEDRRALYSAHNLLILDDAHMGIFVDDPGQVTFDVAYTNPNELRIDFNPDAEIYLIHGDDSYAIARRFRKAIGKSYIPPKFGFGYAQSRWGYKTKEDFRQVANQLQGNHIPVDMINMDIDYMQDYKDFSLHEENFAADFPAFVQEMKERNIHLVPIIDAAIKKQDGYSVYEEGRDNNYFCKLEDGTDFVGAVWPGYAMFTDFLNDEARAWFGNKYQVLLDAGVDAFWNDMNEPAIFFSQQGMEELKDWLKGFAADPSIDAGLFELGNRIKAIKNSPEDYRRFYHNIQGEKVRHDKVHNLYGYYMTRSAKEAFDRLRPDERILMYSRSSYVGMHRYGGIWTGDNKSWWSHLLLLISQLPGLNMTGFLYTGADMGGFGADTTPDLLMRWLQLGMFTPLMRNHSCLGSRLQEPYQFENVDEMAHLIQTRYRLIPYLYSAYLKAALEDDLLFKPLAFDYPQDAMAAQIQDQLLVGNEIMIAPVYTQNAKGRSVYLPEEMIQVTFTPDGNIVTEEKPAGWQYMEYPLDVVSFFIRKGKAIPVADWAMSTAQLDPSTLQMIGYPEAEYELWDDDGTSWNTASTKTLLKS